MHLYHADVSDGKSALAQFRVDGSKVYATPGMRSLGNIAQPWYQIKNNQIYKTVYHPEGHSPHPQFEIRQGKVFSTTFHSVGRSVRPIYTLR